MRTPLADPVCAPCVKADRFQAAIAQSRRDHESPIVWDPGAPGPQEDDEDADDLNQFDHQVPPAFVNDLAHRLVRLGFDPEDRDFEVPVRTWYLDHQTVRRWTAPRVLQLVGPPPGWEMQFSSLWIDQIDPDEWFDLTIITPDPPRQAHQRFIVLDIIVTQSLDLPRMAGLVTITPEDRLSFDLFSVACSFEEHISGFDIISAADIQGICRHQVCRITFGWQEIQNTLRPTHDTSHGDGFQVLVRNTMAPLAQASSSSDDPPGTSMASSSHQWPAPAATADANVSMSSTVDTVVPSSSTSRFTTALHLFQLHGQEVVMQLVNAQLAQPSHDMAEALNVPFNCIEAVYPIPARLVDFPEMAIPAIVQRTGDIPRRSTDRLILIDVRYIYAQDTSGNTPEPTTIRNVYRIGYQVIRSHLLLTAGVFHYCQYFDDQCSLSLDGVEWSHQDHASRPVRHGSYVLIIVPPYPDSTLDTRVAAETLHNDVRDDTFMDFLADNSEEDDDHSLLHLSRSSPADDWVLSRFIQASGVDKLDEACLPSFHQHGDRSVQRAEAMQPGTDPHAQCHQELCKPSEQPKIPSPSDKACKKRTTDVFEKPVRKDRRPSSKVTHHRQGTQTKIGDFFSSTQSQQAQPATKKSQTFITSFFRQIESKDHLNDVSSHLDGDIVPRGDVTEDVSEHDDACRPCTNALTRQQRCSDQQTTDAPDFQVPIPAQIPLQGNDRRPRPIWTIELSALFEELARTRQADIGPEMDVEVWYVHHHRMPRCNAPRIVRLDNIVDLWYADICTVWFDHISRHEPLKVLIVKPRPVHIMRSQAQVHVILEQGMTPGRVALHFTANFLGGPRNGIFQVAESVPDRICTNTMIDLHNFWSFCQERVCHMWSGILRFHRDQPEEIFSGMSALMEVQEARQTASTASSSHLPHDDTTSLMQHQVPSPHATSSTHHGPVQTDVDQAPLSHTPGIPSHAVPSVSHGQVNGPPLLRIQDLASFRQALQWQIERQPQVCGLQNPQPVRVHSWFSDARRLPRSDHFRDVLLGPLPMHWPFEILNRWQDWIDPRHDVTLTLVQPQPSGGSPEVVAHVIVMQAQNPDTRAALITVVELLEDPWHPTSFCTLLPTQVTAQIIMHEAGINDRCRPLNAHQLCEVSHGTIPIDDLMTFPVRHGFQFEVALSSLDEEWDVGVNLIQIGFAQINSHIMKLDHLVKSAYWQFPMKCPARDACDHPQSISVTIIPPLRDGTPADSFAHLTFHSVLQSVWQPLSLLSARPHDPSVTVMTWFLDHIRLPQCFAARPVQLYQDPEEWTHLIRQAWVDFVLQDQPLHFHIVQPNPVDMELDAAVHILLVQQPIDGFDSILVSVIDSAFQGLPHVRHASMAPQILPYQTLLGIAYRDQDCQHAHNTCSAWVGNREILQHEFVPLTDGLSVTVAIHRHIMPPPDEPDPWDSQSPRIDQDRPHILGSGEDDWPLHLSDAQLTTALNAIFFPRPKAQVITKQRHRVTLCLEAVLPDPPDTRWSQLNPDVSAISWFQQQDWATYCASFPVTLPHPIPEGIHVHPSTYHALLDLPLESDPSSWRWELYVDGSQSQGAAGWSVVVVCTDRDRSSLWGCYAGQVQLAPQHEQWIGADCQDNISAELTAFIVAQDVCMRLLPGRPTIIRPDLLLSQMIATYEQITNASPKLAQLCRVLSRWLGKNTKVDQVPAHKGHPWNELADSIARWAAVQEPASLPPWASPGIHALAGAPHDLHWCWLQNAADCVQQCFPPVVQNEIMQFPPSEVQPPIPIPPRSEEATWNTVAFSCATANVLALDHFQHQNEIGRQTGARTARLDTQLHAKGIAVIGIQEARTKQGRYRSEHYQILCWLSRT